MDVDLGEVQRHQPAGDVGAEGVEGHVTERGGENAVSASILGMLGEPVIVLAAFGFTSQLPEERIAEVGERLRDATASASVETAVRPPQED